MKLILNIYDQSVAMGVKFLRVLIEELLSFNSLNFNDFFPELGNQWMEFHETFTDYI